MCHTGKLTQALRAVLWLYMPRLGGKSARSAHNTPRPTYVLSSAAVEAPRVQKNFFSRTRRSGRGFPTHKKGTTHTTVYILTLQEAMLLPYAGTHHYSRTVEDQPRTIIVPPLTGWNWFHVRRARHSSAPNRCTQSVFCGRVASDVWKK